MVEYVRLGDVCDILDAQRIPITECDRVKGDYPYYGANGIQDYVNDYIFDDELVLLAEDGGHFGSKDKPIAYRVSGKCWVNNHAHVLKPKENINVDYLCYSLMFYDVSQLTSGTTRLKLTQAAIRKMKVPLLPLPEQHHIVKILDTVAGFIQKRKKQVALLDDLAKSLFVEMFGDSEYNSQNFPLASLNELCKVGSSKRIYKNEQSSQGIPFLRISDLTEKIDSGLEHCDIYIPVEKYNELCNNNLVPVAGDILVTSRGTLGKCYIVREDDRFYFQDGMISWLSNIDKRVSSLYLSYLFSTQGIKKQIDEVKAGSTVEYLSINMLKKLKIMIPSVSLQQKFAARIEQIETQRKLLEDGLKRMEKVYGALMQEYFG